MNDPKISGIAALNLKDPSLFRQQCYIDGNWADADSGKSIPVNNPATGEILGTVPNMGAAEARRAIEAANAAFPAWRAKTAKERANILRKWFDLMMANQEDLAKILTAEQGKPLAASCTMVLKPAIATPYSALAMAELGERAGIPKGVFSIITGSSSAIGGEVTSNPLVRKVTFTGSTAVGKLLLEQWIGS